MCMGADAVDFCGLEVTEVSRCLREPGHDGECSSAITVQVVLPSVVRELCPDCVVGAGQCSRCNGSGYIFKDPYAITSGEMGIDESELEPKR